MFSTHRNNTVRW